MGSRLVLMACRGTHQTTWYPYRGDERTLKVLGDTAGMELELVCEVPGKEHYIVPLATGENPFPALIGLRKYLISKRIVQVESPEVANTVQIVTR